MVKIKAKITKIKNSFSNFIGKTFSDERKTLKFIAIFIFTVLFLLQVSMLLINNSFYNNGSDDILQYYTIMVDFISGLKEGTISWFNLNNYFGASYFSDVYYIPIDVFTGITFILSYLMNIEVAYSITEFIKIFAGVMLFAYYLYLCKMKSRTIFWMSILYFINGGTISFMAFPVFLSLTAYMPLALIVIHFFFKKKRWLVPLFAMASIFYDFYLGYTILAFSCFAFLIIYFTKPDFKFVRFLKEIFIFVGLLLLGVLMAAILAYPSIIYILEETYRNTNEFDAWIINIFGRDFDFFQFNIYLRMLAKIFVEQKPTGFYGFENNYALEHFSLYISIIGFVYMNYIFFVKDKISRIYKIVILFGIIFMIFPIFSYVFSGTLDVPYTRWINMLPIFQLLILAHVFDKFGFEKVKMKYMTIIIVIALIFLALVFYLYALQLDVLSMINSGEFISNSMDYVVYNGVIYFGEDIPIEALSHPEVIEYSISNFSVIEYYLDQPFFQFIYNLGSSGEYKHSVIQFLNDFKISSTQYSVSTLTADKIFMCITGGYLVVLLLFGWLKKWNLVKLVLWIEIVVAVGYAYSGPFSIQNKVDTFENAYEIESYLDEHINDDEFYRVYIDINNLGVEDDNFNRMTGYATNTAIFHSWTDSETNDLGNLLYDVNEYQSKDVMKYFAYYVYNFLGYKYILVDSENDYGLSNDYFEILSVDENYTLYEIIDSIPFYVYESYLTYTELEDYRYDNLYESYNTTYISNYFDVATSKVFVLQAIIDTERYFEENLANFEENINLEHIVPVVEAEGDQIKSYIVVDSSETIVDEQTGETYYKYLFEDMNITYSNGAIYFKNSLLSASDYEEVYMEFPDGSTKTCEIVEGENYQVKCRYYELPEAVYIKKTYNMSTSPNLSIREEAVIGQSAYVTYDLTDLNFNSDSGILMFGTNSYFNYSKSFVIDENGESHNCLDGFYSYDSTPVKLYAFKTSKMYEYSNLFSLKLKLQYDDLTTPINQDFVSNQNLVIENGKIEVSYINNSDSEYDQILVIPVCYSDDWQFTDSSTYESISVNGGFLGIVIPNGVENVSISMKFVPKGLGKGALASLAGLLIYTGIFVVPYWYKTKKRKGEDFE